MTDEEFADLQARIKAIEAVVFAPRCTCSLWLSSLPPMPESDGTCPKHPVPGVWRDGQPPEMSS